MRRFVPWLTIALMTATSAVAAAAAPARELIDIYKQLHAHPELSHFEGETAALVAGELRAAGYTVTDNVGRYADGSRAHGVVALMKNGAGPTLMIRADMDALPIIEETGLPYASTVTTKNSAGQAVGVMHACGHDIHTTILIGVARELAAARGSWRGTVMLVAQPSEESADGARAMLSDRLYERFGTPDMIVGLHDGATDPAGKVAITLGRAQSGMTAIDVTIRGVGGHGAAPQRAKDPIVLAALFVTQLQTIVSRDENPMDPTVITVGSIRGGTRRNIIPDDVKLELSTRTFSDEARKIVIDGIRARAAGLAVSAGLPADRAPVVTVLEDQSVPALYNDPALTGRVRTALIDALGSDNVREAPPVMPSEDFGIFGLPGRKIPVAYYWLGAANPAAFAAAAAKGQLLPGPHNSKFAPDPVPTIAAGVKSMTRVATTLLH